MILYHKREHSIAHASLIFITKYLYTTMINYECSFIPETIKEWENCEGGGGVTMQFGTVLVLLLQSGGE